MKKAKSNLGRVYAMPYALTCPDCNCTLDRTKKLGVYFWEHPISIDCDLDGVFFRLHEDSSAKLAVAILERRSK